MTTEQKEKRAAELVKSLSTEVLKEQAVTVEDWLVLDWILKELATRIPEDEFVALCDII